MATTAFPRASVMTAGVISCPYTLNVTWAAGLACRVNFEGACGHDFSRGASLTMIHGWIGPPHAIAIQDRNVKISTDRKGGEAVSTAAGFMVSFSQTHEQW